MIDSRGYSRTQISARDHVWDVYANPAYVILSDMLPEDEYRSPDTAGEEDPSAEMDMVPVFSETGAMAELEALSIQGVLDANDIPFAVSGSSTLPVTEFSVQVPASRAEDAQKAIAEAQAAGPAAAEQAEREGELAGLPGESF